MDVDWERYQNEYRYRFRTALYYLEKQSKRLKRRVLHTTKWSFVRTLLILTGSSIVLWLFSAPMTTYGLMLVGVGASLLGWTAFRIHEKSLLEAAAVPDDRQVDTPHQERVSLTSLNYVDAAVGVCLIVSGYTVRIATSLI